MSQKQLGTEATMIRLSLELSPEADALLGVLAEKIGGTKSDVFRKAIVLFQLAVEARRQGKKIGIAEKDQPLFAEIVGII
jgi:predicted transcriptional regulator